MKLYLVLFSIFCTDDLIRSPIDEHERIFNLIYQNALWGKNDEGDGFSGGGSLGSVDFSS